MERMKKTTDLEVMECFSPDEDWQKEEKGRKSSIALDTKKWDKSTWDNYNEARFIEMVNLETGKKFKRLITDKTQFRDIVIISWMVENAKHQKGQE